MKKNDVLCDFITQKNVLQNMSSYDDLSVSDLRRLCKEKSISLPKKPVSKKKLISILEENVNPTPSPLTIRFATEKCPYSKMTVKVLKEECKKKGIRVSRLRKLQIIELLREFDGLPSKHSFPRPPNGCHKDPPSPSSIMSLIDTSDTLVLGSSSSQMPVRDGCFVTKDSKDLWKYITVDKKVPPGSFNTLIISDTTIVAPRGIPRDVTLYTLLQTLKKDGEVKIRNRNSSLEEYLRGQGFSESNTTYMNVGGKRSAFLTFRRLGSSDEEESDGEVNSPVIRPPEEYTLTGDELTAVKIKDTPKPISKTGITLEEFRQELENKEFINRLRISIRNIYQYKISFYKERLKIVKEEREVMGKKINILRQRGFDNQQIKEMFPTFSTCTLFEIELEEILETILHKMVNTTTTSVKKNLIDAIENTTNGLASIIGREDIKTSLVALIYAFSKCWKGFTNSFNNICLMGPSGVGKTMVAKVIAYVFSKCGILATSKIKIVSRSDLVGQYIGHTAPRTRGVLLETLEGVLFIDEAYQLGNPEAGKDFGSESLTEIVNFLDKYIGMNVVIVAGYEKDMKTRFFGDNEGLPRRFPVMIVMREYTVKELVDILILYINQKTGEETDKKTCDYLYTVVSKLQKGNKSDGVFSKQGGDMLNLGTYVVRAIHSSYNVQWGKSVSQNRKILREGVQEYLYMKEMTLI